MQYCLEYHDHYCDWNDPECGPRKYPRTGVAPTVRRRRSTEPTFLVLLVHCDSALLTCRVERRRDRFRPMASSVSALSSTVANGHQVLPMFPPLHQPLPTGTESEMVSTRYLLAHTTVPDFRCQFHNQLATQHDHHQARKPPRPIADFYSVTRRLHHKSRKVSRECCSPVEALLVPTRPKAVRLQGKSPKEISPKILIPQSINPNSRPRNPSEIHRPRPSVELTTTAQVTPASMESP